MKNAAKWFVTVLLGVLALWVLLPVLSNGIFHLGTLAVLVFCGGWLFFLWGKSLREKISHRRSARFAMRVLCALFLSGCLCAGVIAGYLGYYACRAPKEEKPVTVVLLGCQVRGASPSLMLSRRLQAAYDYLEENPEAVCVATGGLGDTAYITEAEAARRYLTGRGISDARIFLEERSVNTRQNLEYSAQLIEENDLPRDIVVVSDSFHQYRAWFYAREQGLAARAVNAKTPLYLYESFFAREILAVVKMYGEALGLL